MPPPPPPLRVSINDQHTLRARPCFMMRMLWKNPGLFFGLHLRYSFLSTRSSMGLHADGLISVRCNQVSFGRLQNNCDVKEAFCDTLLPCLL